jgi:hypothetical protein
MKYLATTTLVSAAALALAASSASAEIACNDEGECWHIKGKADYKPEHGVHVYPDDWKWGETRLLPVPESCQTKSRRLASSL